MLGGLKKSKTHAQLAEEGDEQSTGGEGGLLGMWGRCLFLTSLTEPRIFSWMSNGRARTAIGADGFRSEGRQYAIRVWSPPIRFGLLLRSNGVDSAPFRTV